MGKLDGIKVGDNVIISTSMNNYFIDKVTKVNKLSFAVGRMAFFKVDGREKGGSRWNFRYASLATPENLEPFKIAAQENRLRNSILSAVNAMKANSIKIPATEENLAAIEALNTMLFGKGKT